MTSAARPLSWLTWSRSVENRRTLIPKTFALSFCIALPVALLAYAQILNAYFVSDDFPNIRMTMMFEEAVHTFVASSTGGSPNQCYRPLIALAWFLDFLFAGPSPLFYHVHNVFWHSLCASSLSAVIVLLTKRPAAALLAALVFTIHPLNAEAVSWISSRGDMMAGTFTLGSLFHFLVHTYTRRKRSLAWAALFFALALLTKETGLAVPFYLVVASIAYGRVLGNGNRLRRILKASLPFVGILLAYFLVRKLALGSFLTVYTNLKLEYHLASIADAFFRLVAPHNRCALGTSKGWVIIVACAGLILLITLLSMRARPWKMGGGRFLAFSAASLLAALIPVYQFFQPVVTLEGSRHWYLPLQWACAGWCSFVVTAVSSSRGAARRILLAPILVLLLVYTWVLQENLAPWRAAGSMTGGLVQRLQESPDKEVRLWLRIEDLNTFCGAFTFRNGLTDAIQRPFSEEEYDLLGWPKGRDLQAEPVILGSPWESVGLRRSKQPKAPTEMILVFRRKDEP